MPVGKYISVVLLCVVLALFSGCASYQTLSNYARSGDTVAIAIAPSEPDVMLRKQDVSVVLEDAALSQHPVTLRHLFRVYSDPTSAYQIRSVHPSGWAGEAPLESSAEPNQGYWIGVVDLTDPLSGKPPTLSTGMGQLILTSSVVGEKIMDLEILPGTGKPNPLDDAVTGIAPVGSLEPMPQVLVTTEGRSSDPVGGGVFTIVYDANVFGGGVTRPQIKTTSPDQNIQLLSKRRDNGDGTVSLDVMILNPHGFISEDQIQGSELANGQSLQRDLRFSVVWDRSLSTLTDANWNDALSLQSARYLGLDGSEISGLASHIQKVN